MILLGLGSNLSSSFGDRFKNIDLAISALNGYGIKIKNKSSYYESLSYPNKKEINKLLGRINREGFTLVPTKIYFKKGKAKITIAVAKGKKHYDKRQVKKTRDWNREKARFFRKSS